MAKADQPIAINVKTHDHKEIAGLPGWPAYGHDPGGMRFSPLFKITRKNVNGLTRAWTYHYGEGGRKCESTPLVVDGTMYFSTPKQRVIAIEPETGREIWQYDPI